MGEMISFSNSNRVEGTVKDGTFKGSHAEIFGSGPSRTGTLTLS